MTRSLFVLILTLLFSCSEENKRPKTGSNTGLQMTFEKPVGKKELYIGTLAEIQKRKKLRVLMPAAIDAAFPRKGNLLSFEAELARELARELSVELEIQPIHSYTEYLTALELGRGDIVMASMTITDDRAKKVLFTTPLDYVHEVLVGPSASTAKSLKDLIKDTVSVRSSSAYYQTLSLLKDSCKFIIGTVPETIHTYEIIEDIPGGTYRYTLCDSDIAEAVLSYATGLKVIEKIGKPRQRAWAVSKECTELEAYLNTFIRKHALNRSRLEKELGDLPQIKERQTLRVATRNNTSTYWIHRGKEVGFEYDLCRAFAKKQGLRLEMVVVPDRASLLDWVAEGRADIAAAGITKTAEREKEMLFGAPYLFPQEVVVCRKDAKGNALIKSEEDLFSYPIAIRKSSSYFSTLKELEKKHGKKLQLVFVSEELETENIIHLVAEGKYPVTIADDHLAMIEMSYSDIITAGPILSERVELGWVMRKESSKLKSAVDDFFLVGDFKPKALQYNMLYNRYFKNKREIARSRSDARADIKGVISPYDSLMKKVAGDKAFDWYMIAAQAYQESKFDPKARSWVGAVGLMQLMPMTAKEVGVTNREDPYQSLNGGAYYMQKLMTRFDKTIPYQDRYHFALASYNAGYGHVLDARKLAAKKGWDKNKWFGNVEKAMLLLAKPAYAKRARYGYCRGSEPVTYVQNIQRLYNHYSQVK